MFLDWWGTIAHGIGCLVLTYLIVSFFTFIHACFLRPAKDLKKYGEWALVTGATDGIGKAIAMELSRKGLKILLVSRSADKLEEAKKELPGPGGEICAIDFGDFKKDVLAKAIQGKDIGIVINNVGASYDHAMFFHELDDDTITHLTKLNVDSTNIVTKMCLPGMLEKKKGAIVNTSSMLAYLTCPLYAEYAAVKQYVISLSNALYAEYNAKNIDVQVQLPAYVCSKISKIKKPSLSVPTPETYAKAAVKAIGYEREIAPYWVHYLMSGAVKQMPGVAQDMICRMMFGAIRAKAMKKKGEKAQ